MQFETFILRSLFAACLLICSLVMGAMIYAKPAPAPVTTQPTVAQSATVAQALAVVPVSCALPSDGVICPRRVG